MGITVPTNVAKNLQSTAKKRPYLDVPKDGSLRVRFLPAVEGSDGEIWYHAANHYRLKREDMEGNTALACNKVHGDGDCLLCDVAEFLAGSADKNEKHLGDSKESIKVGHSWYAQVLPATKVGENEDGTHIFEYGEAMLMRLPKTGAGFVNSIMKAQNAAGEPLFLDEKNGKDIVVSRQDTGEAFTKYSAIPAGMPVNLKKVRPDWENQIRSYADMWKAINLNVSSNDEMVAALVRSYPELNWDVIIKNARG